MATSYGVTPAGNLTTGTYVGDNDADDGAAIVFQPTSFASPDNDENGVPAEEGAKGVINPIGSPQDA